MSKIGRKPIPLQNITIDVKGQAVHFKGTHNEGVHELPEVLTAQVSDDGKQLIIACKERSRDNNRLWGLHRALLANKIHGASQGFAQEVVIVGLGYKGVISGNKVEFSLGYSHKIPFELPQGVTIEADKTGQKLTVKSYDKELMGKVCSQIRALRPPEPYKATGVRLKEEHIIRKAGKARAA